MHSLLLPLASLLLLAAAGLALLSLVAVSAATAKTQIAACGAGSTPGRKPL